MQALIHALQPIVDALKYILNFYNGFVHSYGWAIILLTLTIRVALIPLTLKQTKAMKDMQFIQPKLKELQEKYKGDRDRLAQEQMKLYKEHKVNPLGGCLPLLLQMPIFIALFTLLRQPLPKGIGKSWYLISDLSKGASAFKLSSLAMAWPYWLLIGLIVLTMYVSQKQTTTDPQQAKLMAFMPFLMGFISYSLPAGVLLYWVTFNATAVLQQYLYEQYLEKTEEEPRDNSKPARKPKSK
jgi:YidC/Oxa1 family membrane protein insertase